MGRVFEETKMVEQTLSQPTVYGLGPERHTQVNTELRRIQQFLQELAQEIQKTAPPAKRRGFTWMAAMEADSAVGHLRNLLAEENQQSREGILS
jgi:hypothetical protein